MSGKEIARSEGKDERRGSPHRRGSRWGFALIAVGMVFILSGVAAAAWAVGQADAMTEEERLQDPVQYDFYVSAEVCSLGSIVIGLVIAAIGVLGVFVGRRHATVVKEGA